MASASSTSIVLASSSNSMMLGSSSGIHEERGADMHLFAKDIIFVGKGNPQPSKYVIIPKETERDVKTFADNFLLKGLENSNAGQEQEEDQGGFFPSKPGVLISVTGGAQDFYMHSSKLEQVFNRGLLRAAQNISAWIVDGGLDAGVMQYVGKSIKEMAVDDVPCIGIASHKMVILNELLTEQVANGKEGVAEYVANQPNSPMKCALNPNHTHFIMVDTPAANWGQEILFRAELEKYIRDKFAIPVVLIVVNGGPGTLETVAEGAKNNFAIVVVQGSGRACDAIAAMVRRAKLNDGLAGKDKVENKSAALMAMRDESVDVSPWVRLLAEARGDQKKIDTWTTFMDRILLNYKAITLFNADDEASADMDIFILRAILSSPGRKLSLQEKLRLGVVWNRPDIISEIIDTEKDALSSTDQRRGLNEALEQSLLLDRPEIFSILCEKGAQKESVDLKKLYLYKPIKSFFRRVPAYAIGKKAHHKPTTASTDADGRTTSSISEFSADTIRTRNGLKHIFRVAGPAFNGYQHGLDDKFNINLEGLLPEITVTKTGTIRKKKKKAGDEEGRVSFTDFLLWAIVVNRMELAKAIWRNTTRPIHSALVACQLFRYLAEFSSDKSTYIENSDWFEQEAISVMDILEYEDMKDVLTWKWAMMGDKTALDIAQDAFCKQFVGHTHVQNLLDEMFYSDEYGKIEASTTTFRIWATIVLPFPLIWGLYKNTPEHQSKHLMFYHLPIVKFWTNTLFYLAFLFLQGFVLCTLRYGDRNFLISEIILWIWVVSLLVEELMQFWRDAGSHFEHLSNQMDFLLILLHIVYMILRWVSYTRYDQATIFSGSVNTLIVACVFSWGRLLNVFAINHSLGPLFFVIIRLFKDIFLWIFVFMIFAVSFQLGFINITMQAGADPTSPYPNGSFPVSFFTIIGDFTYIDDVMAEAPLGIALLAIYALIAQVMLVNLLIAMMGDTYSKVSENSMEEWKFYRLELVMENQVASFHPPPTNLFVLPFELIMNYREITALTKGIFHGSTEEDGETLVAHPSSPQDSGKPVAKSSASEKLALQKVNKKMRLARDEVVSKEDEEIKTSVNAIVAVLQERLRTLSNERENDRTFSEKRFKDIENAVRSGGGAGAGPAPVGEIAALQLAHQQLAQQNQQILALLNQVVQRLSPEH